ncbi:MAG: hypothetical protein Q9213_000252 [Squamulea squamosa]
MDTGLATVRGDNEEDVNATIKRLDDMAQALYLRQTQPQIYNLVNLEGEHNIRFKLTSLGEHEGSDHRSTTFIGQRLLRGLQPVNLAVLLMATTSGVILTRPQLTINDNSNKSLNYKIPWQYAQIPPCGDQANDFVALASGRVLTDSRTSLSQVQLSPPELAPKSVAEWIATIPQTGDYHFESLDSNKRASLELPTTCVKELEAADNNDADDTLQPKKRFGKIRKKPGLDEITEVEDGEDYEKDYTHDRSLRPTPDVLLSSAQGSSPSPRLIVHLGGPGAEISTQLASTLSTSKTPSHSGSQKSPPADASSSTPSTQSSNDQDLLMAAELELAYPVITPTPAIHNHDTQSRSSLASVTLQSQPPAWVRRNVTSRAENQRPGLLIDCAEAGKPNRQPVSYLAAAKRGAGAGAGAHQTRSGQGQANQRGQCNHRPTQPPQQQPSPISSASQAQTASYQSPQWAAPEVFPIAQLKARSKADPKINLRATQQPVSQTRHRTAAKQQSNNANSTKSDASAVIQMLRSADILGGTLRMEVEIGRILIMIDSVQPNKSKWANIYNAWSAIFDSGKETETIFTNRLPNPHTDLGFPANLAQPDGQDFADVPHDCNVEYQFLCETKLGDEEVLLRVSKHGTVKVYSSEHIVGAIQWHYPKRQWDARLVVKTSERIYDFDDAIKAVSSSLVVVPSPDQTTASISADLGSSGLVFKSASVLREVHFRYLAEPDITMICTEVQYLGPAKERQHFFNGAIDRAAAATTGDLWWEIKLESVNATKQLQLANWSAEDIVQRVTERLHTVATSIVTQIDGLGAGIKQRTTGTSSQTATESWKPSKTSTLVADTFW